LRDVPRSVLILQPLLLVMAMGGMRFVYRAWHEHQLYGGIHLEGEPVFLLGAGDASIMLLRELKRSKEWRVVGLLDDEAGKHGRSIDGVRVLGRLDAVASLPERMQVKNAIIAMPSASAGARRRAAEAGRRRRSDRADRTSDRTSFQAGCPSRRCARSSWKTCSDAIRSSSTSEGLHRLLTGKRVLVTGAGGSIGSELCRQIARFAPSRLVFFEQSEFALYRIEQEFAGVIRTSGIACVVGDVKDASRPLPSRRHRPEVVFHAAAYKHVPLMENENAWEARAQQRARHLRVARAAMAPAS
jgi:FlaA1/EpsC-like NDP-sugar epimerase